MTAQASTALVRPQRGTSLQHQVFVVLRNGIRSGRYRVGEALPGEDRLAQEFGVSRVTMRHALAMLRDEGLVERRQGVGTFVRERAHDAEIHVPHADLLSHIRQVGETTDVRLLALDVATAPPEAAAFLGVRADEPVHRAVRLRSAKGVPVFHVTTYLPDALGATVARAEWKTRSLHDLLAARRIRLASGEQVIGAILADPSNASPLGLTVGAPLLRVRRFHRDAQGRPVAYVEMLASPERFEVHLKLDPPRTTRRR